MLIELEFHPPNTIFHCIWSLLPRHIDPRHTVPMKWSSTWLLTRPPQTSWLSGWILTPRLSQVHYIHNQPMLITHGSSPAYSVFFTPQRTASGPLSIVRPGKWSTSTTPQMTWSIRRYCSILSSKGSPSSMSSTLSCPAPSSPLW